jgi:outer membrane protein assembly factor BamB
MKFSRCLRFVACVVVQAFAGTFFANAQFAITTHHYDNHRTGWNRHEAVLTPSNVNAASFGLLQIVTLDAQVDGQPLVVPGVIITAGGFPGTHDVVYVATENNTIYAIDAESGTVLLSPNFGPPVSSPTICGVSPAIGIHSTPVIDLSSSTMYVLIYTNDLTGPAYRLHALDLGSLSDKVVPQLVAASHLLTDGTTLAFNALYQRQRPALLLANGNVYSAFGAFCDGQANFARGWLMGWTTGTLTPLTTGELIDMQAASPDNYFLSSIWMSGAGPAADDFGNLLFVTGNSQYLTYDGVTNIQESVVKVSSTLSSVTDLFTPADQDSLDLSDNDFGSGGVMILPDQPGVMRHLAVAAGKEGSMFLMNEDNLGGHSSKNKVLGTYSIGGCWCGESYFVDPSDGAARVVSSGGRSIKVWKLHTSPAPSLTLVSSSSAIGGGQSQGFFTSVSSNGSANPIVWALSHPVPGLGSVMNLYAFDPEAKGSALKPIFQSPAGTWPNPQNNSNQVPVVANGRVFVASSGQLQIFGLLGSGKK